MSHDDSAAIVDASSQGEGMRKRKWYEKVPGFTAAKETGAFLDKRLPKIRGRPMVTEFARNLKSGVTVSLVSLPLSVSLALAADATPVQGLLTAIYAGLVSGLFGGSHYNVVGPTGALSGVLSQYSIRYGPGIQPILAMFAGALSLLVWFLGLERFFVFIPSAVMHGFTLGVAFIISGNQLNFILGLPKLPRHEKFLDNIWESLSNIGQTSWFAVLFFAVSFSSLYILQKKFGKIPWSIVLAFIGILIGWWQGDGGSIQTIASRYGNLEMQLIQVSSVFTNGLPGGVSTWVDLITGSISIAIIAVLETLISAHIADRMTKTLFNQPKEVLSVGLANLASGLMGGIPATAALARTALNIKSGATSRASGIINGISILLLSTVLFGAFRFLPLPVVAAILVSVAIRMVEWPEIGQLYRLDKPLFIVMIISGLTCIVVDPTVGIIVGAVLAMIRVLMNLRDGHSELQLFKGRSCLMTMHFNKVKAKYTVAAVKAKYDEEVTEERIQSAGEMDEKALKVLFTTKLAPKEGDETETLRAADGRRGSAVDSDLLTLAPRKSVDSALPIVAYYSLPGYFTFVSAQIHRDRIRALFMPKVGGGTREGLPEDPKAPSSDDGVNAEGVAAAEASGSSVVAVPKPMPLVTAVAFSLQEVYYCDPDAVETIGTLAEELGRAGYEVYLLGFKKKVFDAVEKVHHLHAVRKFSDMQGLTHFLREQVNAEGKYVRPGKAEHHHGHHSHHDPAPVHAAAPSSTSVDADSAVVPVKH